MATVEQQRKSPEYRHAPMSKLVFDEPLPVPDAYAERFAISQPKEQGGELAKRDYAAGTGDG